MTDNDIVKAFESLFKKLLNVKYELKITRKEFLALNRVDTIIKRQQAEIERLYEEANHYQNLWCKAEEDAHNAKAEAIKEFAERLHERSFTIPTVYNSHLGRMIDNLVKEMTEDQL